MADRATPHHVAFRGITSDFAIGWYGGNTLREVKTEPARSAKERLDNERGSLLKKKSLGAAKNTGSVKRLGIHELRRVFYRCASPVA
jgi:hypothetical protein